MRISTRRSDLPMGKSLISKVRYLGLFVPVLLLLLSYQTTYSQFTLTVSVTQEIQCFNGSNGELTANPVGGVVPYVYLWSDGQTDSTATGLSDGSYTVTVTDNN
ncbi:MAG: SprB repeat-containing protein, partial [Bacteroidota bacterium]|nr:SprB repeat-containing protein [Bacteroidota bacterium]